MIQTNYYHKYSGTCQVTQSYCRWRCARYAKSKICMVNPRRLAVGGDLLERWFVNRAEFLHGHNIRRGTSGSNFFETDQSPLEQYSADGGGKSAKAPLLCSCSVAWRVPLRHTMYVHRISCCNSFSVRIPRNLQSTWLDVIDQLRFTYMWANICTRCFSPANNNPTAKDLFQRII